MKTTTTTQPKETYIFGLTDAEVISLQALYMLAVTGAIIVFIIGMTFKWIVEMRRASMMKQARTKLEKALKQAVAAMARDVANITEKEKEVN